MKIFYLGTYKTCNFLSRNFPKVRICLLRRRRLYWGGGAIAAATSYVGSCHLENYPCEVATWKITLGKLPHGKLPLWKNPKGKYPTANTFQNIRISEPLKIEQAFKCLKTNKIMMPVSTEERSK